MLNLLFLHDDPEELETSISSSDLFFSDFFFFGLSLVMFGWWWRNRGFSRQWKWWSCLSDFFSRAWICVVAYWFVHDSHICMSFDGLAHRSCIFWHLDRTANNSFCTLLRLCKSIKSWADSVVYCTMIYSVLDNIFHSSVDRSKNYLRLFSAAVLKGISVVFWISPSKSRLMVLSSYLSTAESIILLSSECTTCSLWLSYKNSPCSPDTHKSSACQLVRCSLMIFCTKITGWLLRKSGTWILAVVQPLQRQHFSDTCSWWACTTVVSFAAVPDETYSWLMTASFYYWVEVRSADKINFSGLAPFWLREQCGITVNGSSQIRKNKK